MIKIDLLKNHPDAIPALAIIWQALIGNKWMPEIGIEEIERLYHEELNHEMPITHIALYDEMPIGSCTLLLKEEFRPDLGPWLGDLVVHPKYQRQGIGKKLVDVAADKARALGFKKLYLFVFDSSLDKYYGRLGWKKIGIDKFHSHPVTIFALRL